MKKRVKKLISLTLFICMLTVTLPSTTMYGSEITPRYNNVFSASVTTTIDNNGMLTIYYDYNGSSNITKCEITTYIEKQTLGIFWSRVNIGKENNEWVQTITRYTYEGVRRCNLSSAGTYRTTVIYEFHDSSGVTDTITRQHTSTY